MNAFVVNNTQDLLWTGEACASLTVSTSVVPLAALPSKAEYVMLTVNANDVVVRFDGTDPTTTVGHVLKAGNTYIWSAQLAAAAEFIRVSADAIVFMTPLCRR